MADPYADFATPSDDPYAGIGARTAAANKPREFVGPPAPEASPQSLVTKLGARAVSAPEAALSMGSGMLGSAIGGWGGLAAGAQNAISDTFGMGGGRLDPVAVTNQLRDALTYQPRTDRGQEILRKAGNIAQWLGPKEGEWAGEKTAELTGSPAAGAAANAGVNAIAMLAGGLKGRGPVGGIARTAAETEPMMLGGRQSIGAAATGPLASTANSSPALQQALAKSLSVKDAAVNPEVLRRHIEADSLPVPVRLTEGQATQDPVILSNERNMRAKHEELAQHFNQQHQQIVDNVQALRDQVGPDVFSTNPVDHGDTLIAAYKAKDKVAETNIRGLYKRLADESGGGVPIDAQAVRQNAVAKLHEKLLFDHAPPEIMRTLDRLADSNNMTFENFESLRTNLATIQRTAADGNARAAAGVIRNTLEDLPLFPGSGAARLKPIADAARQAARARFEALEADPAYKAAVEDSIPPDRFIQKFIVSAPRDNVALMRKNLAGNDAALQTMGVSALDHLRQSAGVDVMGNGSFSQARFNKGLTALAPKLSDLVAAPVAETLQKIGDVSRYIQNQPAGSFVNNSNTAVANAGKAVASAAEGAANYLAHGVPVGTFARKMWTSGAEKRAVRNSMQPGAGLSYTKAEQLGDALK